MKFCAGILGGSFHALSQRHGPRQSKVRLREESFLHSFAAEATTEAISKRLVKIIAELSDSFLSSTMYSEIDSSLLWPRRWK